MKQRIKLQAGMMVSVLVGVLGLGQAHAYENYRHSSYDWEAERRVDDVWGNPHMLWKGDVWHYQDIHETHRPGRLIRRESTDEGARSSIRFMNP